MASKFAYKRRLNIIRTRFPLTNFENNRHVQHTYKMFLQKNATNKCRFFSLPTNTLRSASSSSCCHVTYRAVVQRSEAKPANHRTPMSSRGSTLHNGTRVLAQERFLNCYLQHPQRVRQRLDRHDVLSWLLLPVFCQMYPWILVFQLKEHQCRVNSKII